MLLPDSAPVCAPAESIAGVLRKEGLDVGSASVLILRERNLLADHCVAFPFDRKLWEIGFH